VSVTAGWQTRFDTDFPYGLTMTWRNQRAGPRYPIGWVRVLHIIGAQPVVRLDSDADKSFVVQLTGYTVLFVDPLYALVTGHDLPISMLWSAAPANEQ
jgi:hypothetical protein